MTQEKSCFFLCAIMVCTMISIQNIRASYANHIVDIDTDQCVWKTDEKFLSIALGSGLIRERFHPNFDFSSIKLQTLAKGLSPAYLRIGGTNGDFLLFDPDENSHLSTRTFKENSDQKTAYNGWTNFTMTTKDVDNLFSWAYNNELKVIFGLNILQRDSKTNLWNSTNAQQLMKYLISRGFTCDWELGNEPFDLQKFNRTISGKQLAENFRILRKLLNKYPEYENMIAGPDLSSPWKSPLRSSYFKEFLENINDNIDALTYHQYYTNKKATVSKFYDVSILDSLIKEVNTLKLILENSKASIKELWLGETSSAYGGGVPGVSNSYIAGFMWLDKLGLAARSGHSVVIRQTFYGGSYDLVDQNTFDPFPDYWSSYLYKMLVGQRVLKVVEGMSLGRALRVYAHCISQKSGYTSDSIVLIALNTKHTEAKIILTKNFEKLTIHQYLLTPCETGNLTSQKVKLNGKLLEMLNNKTLPHLQPKPISADNIILPPVSYGFYVILETQLQVCKMPCSKKNFKAKNVLHV
ncbi:heparanase-like [Xenia sp. Carnegie-2017]|uniref:heparanase-like n=1 Tax=Xenia sp. Carnegie-2017 TaxID=2897299 RepID=UPI001F0395D6|nr:heparanase-like [Xenia sp. Carnegie-2017]